MQEHALAAISIVLLVGIGCQWIAWRAKMPAILFLLLSGIIAGPLTHWLNPDALFGNLLFPFISLSVAVILFEGSLTLRFRDIRGLEKVIRNMITYGVAITWLITACATRFFLGFSWEVSFVCGALMVVTGPTVIAPLLRTVRPIEKVAHILRWEGITIDPIGATLAVLVFEFIISGGARQAFSSGTIAFLKMVGIGGLLGAAGGQLTGVVLRRHWVPRYLHNVSVLVLVCAFFVLSDTLAGESGLLAVTVMGVWMANMQAVELDEILDFKESLSLLLISMLFIVLAARMNLQAFMSLGWPAIGVFGAIQFFSRPLNVQVSALGSTLSMAERHLLAWIAPRGIVAAAVSAVFAIKLGAIGYPEASRIVPLTFTVIIATVLLQSLTAGPIARWLDVAEPEPTGFLIIGADTVARAIGKALQQNGFRVMLADPSRDHFTAAKMEKLPVYWGNPVSDHAGRHLDLTGIGRLLALSPSNELNALAALHYRMDFGANNVFSLRTHPSERQTRGEKALFRRGGIPLFQETITHAALARRLAGGAKIQTTTLTGRFSYEAYLGQQTRIPLFAINPGQRIFPLTSQGAFSPQAEWKIIGLGAGRQLSHRGAPAGSVIVPSR